MNTFFQRYPQLQSSLPFVSLGSFPTAVDGPLELGPHKIWIKRDDLSGELHGGNKVRKLELALGAAKEKGAREIVLGGARGSNWCVAAIIYGKKLGFSTKAILFPQPETPFSKRNFEFTTREAHRVIQLATPVLLPFWLLREKLRRNSMVLPLGGTSGITSLGYVNAALELRDQIDQGLLPEPHEIWLALGTGGTTAGLIAGCKLAGISSKIMAVRVVDRIVSNRWLTLRLVARVEKTLARFGVVVPKQKTHLKVLHHSFGKGYGHPTTEGKKGMEFFRERAGIELEPTYTAKTAGALLERLDGEASPKRVLFWNTYNSRPLR